MLTSCDSYTIDRQRLTRRRLLKAMPAAALLGGACLSDTIAVHADELRRSGKAMILLWMAGGPPQTECFDPKPQLSELAAIDTATPGVQFGELWPEMARSSGEVCVVRSLNNKEGEHQRASYQVHTGYIPSGSVRHPALGSSLAKQLVRLEDSQSDLPPVARIASGRGLPGAGFLGADWEPFHVESPGEMPRNIAPNVDAARFRRRLALTSQLDDRFARSGHEQTARDHADLYAQTAALVTSPDVTAFDLSGESASLRADYGETDFGRGCLLARRLVERGVRFVEVVSRGWDMHDNLAGSLREKAGEVDPAMATLLRDLKSRGLLDDTLVVWMGEFGRTPRINGRGGRDHYPRVFSAVMAGCGVRGGSVVGASSDDGTRLTERPVTVGDLHATFCRALGLEPTHEEMSPVGRPLRIVDQGSPIDEVFG